MIPMGFPGFKEAFYMHSSIKQFVQRRHVISVIFSAGVTHAHDAYCTHHTRIFWHGQPLELHGNGFRVASQVLESNICVYMYLLSMQLLQDTEGGAQEMILGVPATRHGRQHGASFFNKSRGFPRLSKTR